MNMSTNSLQAVQTTLDERGVRDVKFFFSDDSHSSLSDAKQKVAYILETYLRGDAALSSAAGDSKN